MNNKELLFVIIVLNVVMVFLLVHKQNKIIKALYELQQLQEQKEDLLQQKKELMLMNQKGQQLSSVQTYATNNLAMIPIQLKETKVVDLSLVA